MKPSTVLARLLPRSLFARVALIVVVGLAAAQLLAYAAIRYERGLALRELMMLGIERDIASSVALLDRLPAAERGQWLDRLERRNYRFVLAGQADERADLGPAPQALHAFTDAIVRALRPYGEERVAALPGPHEGFRTTCKHRSRGCACAPSCWKAPTSSGASATTSKPCRRW